MENTTEMEIELEEHVLDASVPPLSAEDELKLMEQNKRLLTPFKVQQLELNAQKHWDLFYKRNEMRFFKDRHWTTREFEELLQEEPADNKQTFGTSSSYSWSTLLEVGCGVGNFLFPLIQQLNDLGQTDKHYYACDFSPRAIQFMQSHPLYEVERMQFFQCDITVPGILTERIPDSCVDIAAMIFVMSAITPEKFDIVVSELHRILRPGGLILFRDYGRYDMAQLRFKPGHKIAENFYMRQDGTRSYFFTVHELHELFQRNGFQAIRNDYIYSRTRNIKEAIDVQRIFVQGKFQKLPV